MRIPIHHKEKNSPELGRMLLLWTMIFCNYMEVLSVDVNVDDRLEAASSDRNLGIKNAMMTERS